MNTATRRLPLLLAGITVALALSGCSAIGNLLPQAGPERDSETQELTTEGTLDVFQIAVGDCMKETDSTEVSDVPAVPCTEPHDLEAYHAYTIPAGDYPGEEAIDIEATAACSDALAEFIGMPIDDSEIDFTTLYPTETGWTSADDREVICLAVDTTAEPGTTVGSLRGAGR